MLANHQLNFPAQPRVHTGIAMLESAVAADPAMMSFFDGRYRISSGGGIQFPFYQMVGAVRFELAQVIFIEPLKSKHNQ